MTDEIEKLTQGDSQLAKAGNDPSQLDVRALSCYLKSIRFLTELRVDFTPFTEGTETVGSTLDTRIAATYKEMTHGSLRVLTLSFKLMILQSPSQLFLCDHHLELFKALFQLTLKILI
jgi:hypothetical protein